MVSQESIDSINDTIVTQPKASHASASLSASEKILNGTISSGTSALKQTSSTVSSSSYETSQSLPMTTYETYRPPISHERINPFDKNKTTSSATVSSYSYTPPPSTYTPAPAAAPVAPITSTYKSDISLSGFDYSYKPPDPPMVYSKLDSVDKAESEPPATSASEKKSDFKRPELERKLSDADIVFGAKPSVDYSSYKYSSGNGYTRNRSNSSFTSSTTDSDYVYGSREAKRENSFQKSLSVSSDKDGDFTNDPQVLATRSGIANDAFSDFDSPASNKPAANKLWSNNDDDFDLK